MDAREGFQKLDFKIIGHYLATKEASGIPDNVKRYIEKIEKVPEIYRIYPSRHQCAKELCNLYPNDIGNIATAYNIIADAINFFHLNNDVSNAAWYNYFADMLLELSKEARDEQDFKTAMNCYIEACNYRVKANHENIRKIDRKPRKTLITTHPNVKNVNLRKLWTDADEFINSLPEYGDISQKEMQKFKKEVATNLGIVEDATVIENE